MATASLLSSPVVAAVNETINNKTSKDMKKVIIINASPRKNMNTAQLLKEAQEGAESVGAETESIAPMFFHGQVKSYASLDTLQVKDYSRYAMRAFDDAAKRERHERQFPIDLQECFKMGAELSK